MKRKPELYSRSSPKQKRTGSWTSRSGADSLRSERKSNSTAPFKSIKKELAIYETITLVFAAMGGTLLLLHVGLALIEYLIK